MTNPVTDSQGTKRWYNSMNQLHREDGPAVITGDGNMGWYVNGKLHRTDGPSIIYADGTQSWYVDGKEIYRMKQFQKAAKLTDEEMTLIILKYGNVK